MNRLNRKHVCCAKAWVVAFCFLLACAGSNDAAVAQTRAVWSATPVQQTNGTSVKMPLKRPVSRSNGLTLTIDTRWTQNYGYRPVEVTVSSTKPVTRDHAVSIKLFSGWNGTIRVEQELKLPSGSTSVTETVLVPQYQAGTQFYWWEARVDGFLDKDLSLKQSDAYGVMQSGYATTSGISFLAMALKAGQRSLVAPNSMDFEILTLAGIEFPKRWIDYTCLDAATLSIDELIFLKNSNPDAFQAMRFWLRAGGQLWVNDVGDDFQRLPELSKLLRLSETVAPDVKLSEESELKRDEEGSLAPSGWRSLRFPNEDSNGQVTTFLDHRTGKTRLERNPEVIARLQADSNFSVVGQRFEAPTSDEQTLLMGDSDRWFVEQPIGLGTVRAFRGVNDVSLFQQARPAANANVAANQDGSEDLPPSLSAALVNVGRWSDRHGTAPDDANSSFSDLLVPGMGLAPVTEFQVLITLFVVVIGPVNYFLLKRWRRLHLMVLTVPLAAGLVTLALFAYAIITDGFGTTVRANSYTALDQRTGESACWSRLSYYSGLAPREGLTMPVDVAMYPIVPDWNGSSIDSIVNSERDLKWVPEEARLTRGWLRSRTPTQYLTVRARTSPIRLELTPVRERLRAKNSLGTKIDFVVVVDEANKLWLGEKLDNENVGFLQAVERSDAVERFRKLVRERSPQAPDALTGLDTRTTSYQRRQWQMMRGYSSYGGTESLETNLANASIAALAGHEGREGLALPPNSYVAVTETGPEVVFGMEGVEEEASFHVIVGQW